MLRRIVQVAAILWCAVLCGCGDLAMDPSNPGQIAPHLRGLSRTPKWVLKAMTAQRVSVPLVSGREPTLSFSNLEGHGNTGCNHFSGSFTAQSDGTFRFNNMDCTEMACPATMKQEQDFLSILSLASRFRIKGQSLVISDGTSANELTFVPFAAKKTPLKGTKWTLTHFTRSDGETDVATSVVQKGAIHMLLFKDSASGSGACNCFHCDVEYSGSDSIAFDRIELTEKGGSKPSLDQEQQFIGQLGKMTRWRISDGTLTLTDDLGTIGLQWQATAADKQ